MEKSEARKNVELLLLLAGPVLILLGIIYQSVYYSFFNIEITRYMELPEIIISFTNELLLILIAYVGVSCFIIYLSQQKPIPPTPPPQGFKNILKDLNVFIKSHLNESIISIAFLLFMLFAQIFAKGLILTGLLVAMACIIIAVRIHLGKYIIGYFKRKEFNIGKFIFDHSVVLVIVITWFADAQSASVVNNKTYINSVIYFKSDTIRSSQFRFYIGQTNKYIFVYDLKKDITTVYPMSDVVKLEFGKIIYVKDRMSTETK